MSRRRSSATPSSREDADAAPGSVAAATGRVAAIGRVALTVWIAAAVWVSAGAVTGAVESLLVALRHGYYFNTTRSLLSFLLLPAAAHAVVGVLIGAALTLALGPFVRSARRALVLSASLCIPFFVFLFWGSALDGRFFGTAGNAVGHVAMVAAAAAAFVLARRILSRERGVQAMPVVVTSAALLAICLAVAVSALPHGTTYVPAVAPNDSSDPSVAGPNILLVTLDTVRADRTGYSGYSSPFGPRADGLGITPRLDGLASRGTVFTNAIVPEVVTDPSHASLLTGVPPWEHGVVRNAMPLRRDVPVLAELLADAGYNTAAFVSVEHLDGHISHLSRGFRLFADRGWADRYRHHVGGRVLERHAPALFAHERSAMLTATAAADWLQAQRRSSGSVSSDRAPFFLWVHVFDPHMPYVNHETGRVFSFEERESLVASVVGAGGTATEASGTDEPPPTGEERSTAGAALDAYDSEVRFADDGLGVLLDAVERTGALSNTVVVVTSDHGEHMQEQHVPPENWFAHVDPYDEVCRVPLVMAGPGIPSDLWIERQVSSMDIAPTILELAGISGELGGRSGLADLLTRPMGESPPARASKDESPVGEQLVILSNPHRGIDHRAVRDGRWKVIERGGLPVEVYDLESDPGETVNNIHSAADVLSRAAAVLAETPVPEGFSGVAGAENELDPALREMLEALGYVQ